MSAAGSRRVRNTTLVPGRRLTWATWPSTQIQPNRATQAPIFWLTTRTGQGSSAVLRGSGTSAMVVTLRPSRWTGSQVRRGGAGSPVRWDRDREESAAGQAAGVLRRRRSGGPDGRGGVGPLRAADLRAQGDRAQQARGHHAAGAGCDLRGGERRGA